MWRCSQDQDAGRGDEGRLVCLGLVSVRSDRSGHIYMWRPLCRKCAAGGVCGRVSVCVGRYMCWTVCVCYGGCGCGTVSGGVCVCDDGGVGVGLWACVAVCVCVRWLESCLSACLSGKLAPEW